MRLNITLWLGLTFGLAYSHSSEPIKPEQFNKLHSIIKPNSDEEKFMQIPWMIDLGEARKKAASEDRPILLWEMDGHPLGCV